MQDVVPAGMYLKVEVPYGIEGCLLFVGCGDREDQELPLLPGDREGKGHVPSAGLVLLVRRGNRHELAIRLREWRRVVEVFAVRAYR